MQLIKNYTALHKQNGIALLMAIIIVAFVVIISVNMLTQRQLQIHQSANIYNKQQSWQYLLASERWAKSVLAQDYKDEIKRAKGFDGYQDAWNKSLKNLDTITVEASISDLQGRLNLNNLYYRGKVQTQWLNVYRNLLGQLKLPVSLADSLLDWIDKDNEAFGTYGAEDEYYLTRKPAYRAAHTHLVQLSELKLIRGYNDEIIEILRPYVYVADDLEPVNINTANKKVLQAVMKNVHKKEINRIIEQQKNKAFRSIEEFMNSDTLKNTRIDKNLISVSSVFFMVHSYTVINHYPMQLSSLLKRNLQGEISIIHRLENPVYE